MSDEQQIAALREEIRLAGKVTRGIRAGLAAPVVALVLLLVAATLEFASHFRYVPFRVLLGGFAPVLGRDVLAGASVVLLVAYPVALSYRSWRRLRLYKKLSALPQEQRAAVLVPLRTEKVGDTRKIVEPLIRQFRLPTELAPAAAPDARGDEPTPAEQPHGARLDR